jgi:hypothetical protein
VQEGDETLQQRAQIVPRADYQRNRSDGGGNDVVAHSFRLSYNDCGLGGAYSNDHGASAPSERRGESGTCAKGHDSQNGLPATDFSAALAVEDNGPFSDAKTLA